MAKNPITIEVLETPDAIDRRGSFAEAAEGYCQVKALILKISSLNVASLCPEKQSVSGASNSERYTPVD